MSIFSKEYDCSNAFMPSCKITDFLADFDSILKATPVVEAVNNNHQVRFDILQANIKGLLDFTF